MTEEPFHLEYAGLVTDSLNVWVKISLIGSGCSGCHKNLRG